MARFKKFYLIDFQYLGFRFHGWQKQPQVKTLHEMVDKTLSFALGHENFKTMGASRTDAKVSARNSKFELFLNEPLNDLDQFLEVLNSNFPFDLRATAIKEVTQEFNIIQSSKIKEYHYYFSHGKKPDPYSSPYVYTHLRPLNVDLMQEGATLFMGRHNFRGFCSQPKENATFEREIIKSEVVENDGLKANFFPENVWIYKVSSAGFLRNQVRLMIGSLLQLGDGRIVLSEIENTLQTGERKHSIDSSAPASGLHLFKNEFF